MPIIVPAILEKTKETFNDKVSLVTKIPGVERIQVDFGDGIFIQDQLLDVGQMNTLNPAFEWEAHLMCKEPKDLLDYSICGFKILIFHHEAFNNTEGLKSILSEAKNMGFKTGVAINPSTPVSVLKNLYADQYLVMSVMPGKQGREFEPQTVQKISALRAMYPRAIIEVDGGINETNIKSVKQAGADLICVGSALVKAESVIEAYGTLHHAMSA